jgi:hypothetical protein
MCGKIPIFSNIFQLGNFRMELELVGSVWKLLCLLWGEILIFQLLP